MHALRPAFAFLIFPLLALTVACSGDDSSGSRSDGDAVDVSDATDVSRADEISFPEATPDGDDGTDATDATDATPDGDSDVEVEATCETDPGGFGCPCTDNTDCNSDFCIPSRDGGRVCTQYCTSSCPLDWSCTLVQQPSPDTTFICIEVGLNLCRPCTSDAQCQAGAIATTTDRCVKGEDDRAGAFCGLGCADDGFCPDGYTCKSVTALEGGAATQQCVPTSGTCECSGRAIEEDATTACNDRACVGVRTCTEFGLSACDARPYADETCDGRDNDCDDATDEGFVDSDEDHLADCVDPDDDNDTVLDDVDNCVLTPNLDQLNSDTDPLGNACDPDDDDDTILDGADNCPLVANTDQADSDGVAPGDACDLEAPLPPSLDATDPLSPSSNDNPSVSGTSEVGSTVTFYTDPDCSTIAIGSALTTAQGSFFGSVTVPTNTTSVLHGTATDGAGNVSDCSPDPLVYTHDSLPPATPVLTATEPTSPSRTVLTPKVSGTGDADDVATARLYVGTCSGTPLGTAPIVGGTFAISGMASPNATTPFVADAVDVVGNVSGCSAPLEYIHDSQAPSAPVLISTTPPSPSNNNTTPVINGTAEIATTITLYTSSACTTPLPGTALADATTGVFAATGVAAANATTTFYAKATDQAGNVSGCSVGLAYVHDGSRPNKPVLVSTTPASPAPSTSPTVRGTADAGTTVRLYADACVTPLGAPTAPTVAANDKSFSFATSLSPNTTTNFRASATDSAGNVSDCSDPLEYVADSQPPTAPILTGSVPTSPSNELTPTVSGTSEIGVTVRLYAAANCAGSAVATFGPTTVAQFTRSVTAAENATTTFTATATDAAGNLSVCSAPLTYTHDGSAPTAPVLTGTTPTSPSSTDTTPIINGTFSEPGASIELFANGSCSGTAVTTLANATTTFAIGATVTPNSTTTFTARARDTIGNTSGCSNSVSYVHDTAAPGAPSITASNPTSPGDSLTPTLSGIAEPSTSIRIFLTSDCTGTIVGSGTADASGLFASITVTANADTTTTFYAKAIDSLDNGSPCSAGFAYRHDSGAPAAPVITSTNPASPSTDVTPDVIGTSAEAGLTVYIYKSSSCTNGTHIASGTSGAGGTFSINVEVGVTQTTNLYAKAVDSADNASPCSSPAFPYTHVQPVGAPVIERFAPPTPSDTTRLTSAVGTAANFTDKIILYLTDNCTGTAVNPSGVIATANTFSIPFEADELSCTRVSAKAIGTGGNESACSNSLTYNHYGCAQCVCTNEDWIRQFGTPAAEVGTASVYNGSYGDVYVVGTTGGALNNQSYNGDLDAFLAEYDNSGEQTPNNTKLQFGSAARDTATAVEVDESTNVYIAGMTEGNIDGSGVPTNADAWVAKVDTSPNGGMVKWIKRYATARPDGAVDLVYQGGKLLMLVDAVDTSTGTKHSPSVVSINLATGVGTTVWSKFDDTFDMTAGAIGAFPGGSFFYVMGRAEAAITGSLAPSGGALTTNGTTGGGLYIYRVNSSSFADAWLQHWGSAGNDEVGDIFATNGDIYATGVLRGVPEGANPLGSYAGRMDIGVVRISGLSGTQQWARIFGTAADDRPTAIGLDGSNVHVLGATLGTITIPTSSSSSNGGVDELIARFASDGTPGTYRQFGTFGDDVPGRGVLDGGKWYVPGTTTADWVGLSQDACTYHGEGDVLLSKFCVQGL